MTKKKSALQKRKDNPKSKYWQIGHANKSLICGVGVNDAVGVLVIVGVGIGV